MCPIESRPPLVSTLQDRERAESGGVAVRASHAYCRACGDETTSLCCASPCFDSNAKLFDHFLCLLRGKESLAQMPPHERLAAGSDGLGHQFAQRCDSFLMMTKISAAFCDQGAHPNRGRFLIEQAQSSNG